MHYSKFKVMSQDIKDGDIFLCTCTNENAKKYLDQAVKNGASECFIDSCLDLSGDNIKPVAIKIKINDVIEEYFTSKPENIVAVTGTNGKTSSVAFMKQMMEQLGHNVISIGTVGVISSIRQDLFDEFNRDNLTTPDKFTMRKILHIAKHELGIDYAFLEASSHALTQDRLDGIDFVSGCFTNLTQDHLDYHKNMDEYLNAKLRLVHKTKKHFIVNSNDRNASFFISEAKNNGLGVMTYGDAADLSIKIKSVDTQGQNFVFSLGGKDYDIKSAINGEFQVYNLALAFLGVMSLGFDPDDIAMVIPKLNPPIGRLERIPANGCYTNVYVDYAHTPDALEKALMTLRKVAKNGKLIALFGCGGNRDKTKRPKMMRICLDNADEVIITDDNPRFEEPHDIRRDIISELEMKNIAMKSFEIGGKRICDVMNFEADDKICYEIKGTRSDAIKYGISIMNDGDVLLIAGKGHEDYQIIKGTKYHFSDQEEVIECFGN